MPSFLENALKLNLLQGLPQQQQEEQFNPFQEGAFAPALNAGADAGNAIKQGGFNILNSLGSITGYGSPLWGNGLDIDLQKGQPVPSPVSGVVDFVGDRGGFGNQVRIKGDDGRSYWLSHLDAAQAQVGQRVGAGQNIGLGGNSGSTIPGPGGDGSHLDLTVQENGNFLNPRSIADLLKSFSSQAASSQFSDLLSSPF